MTASRLRSKAVAISAALAVLAAAVGIGWWYLRPDEDTITVTAQFDSASGLYEGNVVAVLGMPVGKITKINAKGGYVEVEFTVDRHVKVPATRKPSRCPPRSSPTGRSSSRRPTAAVRYWKTTTPSA